MFSWPAGEGTGGKMEADALVFMLIAWGFTLGLLAFCVVMLAKHPEVVSVLTNNIGDDNRTNDEPEEESRRPAGDG